MGRRRPTVQLPGQALAQLSQTGGHPSVCADDGRAIAARPPLTPWLRLRLRRPGEGDRSVRRVASRRWPFWSQQPLFASTTGAKGNQTESTMTKSIRSLFLGVAALAGTAALAPAAFAGCGGASVQPASYQAG